MKLIDEYLAFVYYELYKETGLIYHLGTYDPMSLLYDANKHDIKKGFRGLANKYHPDKGGDVNG